MSVRGWLWGTLGGALGVAAAGTAVQIARHRSQVDHGVGDSVPLGTLHSAPLTVVTEDGVRLHVEVDEVGPDALRAPVEPGRSRRDGRRDGGRDGMVTEPVTVVFAHGFCLNLDCWHFQRAAYRGLVRAVYYDQRSHGRSEHSAREHATIEQLGRDLKQILDEVVPEGPVVLVGHSMGGMTIVALAEEFPELIGDRVIGVALLSTTAGGLDPSRVLLPMLPARLTGLVTGRAVSALNRGHGAVDTMRRLGAVIANTATHRFAFGGDVPRSYVTFVDDMLSRTPFEVVAEFFPSFSGLDKFDFVEVLGQVPVSIICGTADRLTSVGHSRKLHSRIAGSDLMECEGAGHMVLIERHSQVNAELDQLITAATTRAGAR